MTTVEKPSVVFVDDEPLILDGLRRQLRGRRDRWDMRFVDSGEAALRELEARPAALVVSDMRMPGMTGADLLLEVQKRWPATARIILSGQTNQAEVEKGLGAIHQFLQKPCEENVLCRAMEAAFTMVASCANAHTQAMVAGLRSLPVLSDTLVELTRVLKDANSGLNDISAAIEKDMALAVKVVQLVNSSFFGIARHVSSVHQAVILLGAGTIQSLAMSSGLFEMIGKGAPGADEINDLWSKSIEIGNEAGRLAKLAGQPVTVSDKATMAGGLSLIGRSILIRSEPERFMKTVEIAKAESIPLYQAEAAEFGVTQQMIGGFALGLWGFDPTTVNTVVQQVDPQTSTADQSNHPLSYVHLARCVSEASDLVEQIEPSHAFIEAVGLRKLLPVQQESAT
ncbi:MAG: HDOD domain-containing protein [Planctomycetota bacterium]